LVGIIQIIASAGVTYAMDSQSSVQDLDLTPVATEVLEEPTATPSPEPPPPPPEPIAAPAPPPPPNRTDCNLIRGTNYLSSAERSWFLANCLGR
jgi:hypothetical protein